MATNYARGAAAERLIRDLYRAFGYHVVRSAGSRGAIDLVATSDRLTHLIQVKRAPISVHIGDDLLREIEASVPLHPRAIGELWSRAATAAGWIVARIPAHATVSRDREPVAAIGLNVPHGGIFPRLFVGDIEIRKAIRDRATGREGDR